MAAGVVATALSLVAGWWLAGRALAPVGELTTEAAAIGASDLARRLPTGGRDDELGRLATTLNAMLDRVEGSVVRQRAFLAAASHDLRTPLAALQTELELADRPDAGDAASCVPRSPPRAATWYVWANSPTGCWSWSRQDPMVEALAPSAVPLVDVVAGTVEHVRPLTAGRRIELRTVVQPTIIVVDRVRLEQALRNILANAITYSPDGGVVDTIGRVDTDPDGRERILAVDVLDRGPGIPSRELELVFEPFRRGSNALGPGTGLGLSAARSAVAAHRGSLVASARPGGGTRVSLRMPLGHVENDGPAPT